MAYTHGLAGTEVIGQPHKWLAIRSRPADVARRLRDVADPTMRVILLVPGRVRNLQVLHGQSRHIIHGNLKTHGHWSDLLPALGGRGFAKSDLRQKCMFMAALELFDGPLCDLLLRLVLKALSLHSFWQLICGVCSGAWNREANHDLSCEMILRELGSDFDGEPESVARLLIDERVNAERCRVLSVDAVVHDEELAIWRVDRDCLHGFEVSRIDALVEVAIVECHTPARSCVRSTDREVVIQDQAQLRVPY